MTKQQKMAEIYISPAAAQKIVNNPYYHLKHYGELPHLDSNYYLNIMSIAEEEAKNKLKEII